MPRREYHWTLRQTIRRDGVPQYQVPRVLRVPGMFTAHGSFVASTEHWVLGVQMWRSDGEGSAGFRVGIGPLYWEVYTARLLTRRAVERRMARRLVVEAEEHLGASL